MQEMQEMQVQFLGLHLQKELATWPQDPYLENPMDRAWQATVQGVTKNPK